MKFDAALIREQGVHFAVVVVKRAMMSPDSEAAETIEAFRQTVPLFADIPLVLAANRTDGGLDYRGREDLVRFLASVPASALPWKEYETNL